MMCLHMYQELQELDLKVVQKIKLFLPVKEIFIHLLSQTYEPCNKYFYCSIR